MMNQVRPSRAVVALLCQVFMHIICAFSESYLRAGFVAEMKLNPKVGCVVSELNSFDP